MDRTGVDDPEQEQNIIRAEQTDVSLNPAAVQVIASVATQLQAMGMQNAQQAVGQMGGAPSPEANMADMRAAMGAAEGQVGSGEQPMPAEEAMPGNTPEGEAVGAGPVMEPGSQMLAQTQVKGGEASNRLLFQQQIGQAPPPEEA
jgi:hypothetical protein